MFKCKSTMIYHNFAQICKWRIRKQLRSFKLKEPSIDIYFKKVLIVFLFWFLWATFSNCNLKGFMTNKINSKPFFRWHLKNCHEKIFLVIIDLNKLMKENDGETLNLGKLYPVNVENLFALTIYYFLFGWEKDFSEISAFLSSWREISLEGSIYF